MAESIELDVEVYLEETASDEDYNDNRKWRRRYSALLRRVWNQKVNKTDGNGLISVSSFWFDRYVRLLQAVEYGFRGRGAPKKEARAKLIISIMDAYGNPPKTRWNYFEETVAMVLNMVDLDGAPEDIHKAILTAVKQHPYPFRND